MRKTMIALAAAFAVCTATMTSGATAAFARGGGSFWRGAHGFGGGGFGGHGFAVGRGDIGHFGGAGSATLAAVLATDASADLDLASMDTRAGPTTTTAMGPVRCPLRTAMPGLATDIQHRNLLSALHPQPVRRPNQLLGRQPRPLPYGAHDGHTATDGRAPPSTLSGVRW
jgi:hypothetical protein